MRIRILSLGVTLVLALVLAPSGSADWLVLKDGTKVETSGGWQVKGRLIVFKGADGKLASLRATEVDLEASEAATEEAKRPAVAEAISPAQPAAVPKAPVLVLTDADVNHVDPDAPEEESAAAPPQQEQPLTVISWEQEADADGTGVVIQGTMRNDGAAVASKIRMTVNLLGPAGEVVGSAAAQLSQTSLNSGEILNFRARVADVVVFENATFEIGSSASTTPATPAGTAASSLSIEAEP